MVRDGVLDMIGAARPSIADPFLPRKIEEGRLEDIRECIGCNICVSGDGTISPIRCTQNPSMGEEWRRGWHPEVMRPKTSDASVLVVGAGPAGLEAAMALGKRGHRVVLAEATQALGGRVAREARLPGLAEWIRVLDYRRGQLDRLPDVEIAYDSRLTAEEVLEYGFDHVAVATGCRWRADGVGRWHLRPIELEGIQILTPDDVMAGTELNGGRVVVYDDDHYYLGGVVAEALARSGHAVTFVTPAARVSEWTVNTLEQVRIQRRMLEAGIEIVPSRVVDGASAGAVRTSCVYTSEVDEHAADALVLVTSRLPDDGVAADLVARAGEWEAAGLTSVRAVGDALCPGTIAAAVWDGRRYAEQLGEPLDADGVPFLREIAGLSPDG
jgi:dimethylamine/trimethylamine dehydrogenase